MVDKGHVYPLVYKITAQQHNVPYFYANPAFFDKMLD
jgi:hypothetical protein